MKYFIKKNMAAVIISIIAIFGSIIYIPYKQYSSHDATKKITKYEINATFDEFGNMSVIENVTFQFNKTYHTIFKDFIYKKSPVINSIENDNTIFDQSQAYVIAKDKNGNLYSNPMYRYSWKNDLDELGERVTCASDVTTSKCVDMMVHVPRGFDDITTFEYHYKINNVTSSFNDFAGFNWIFIDQTNIKISNIKLNIGWSSSLNPIQIDTLNDNFYLHGDISYENLIINQNGISIDIPSQQSFQLTEIRAGFDKSLVSKSTQTYNISALQDLKSTEAKIKRQSDNQIKLYNTLTIFMWTGLIATLILIVFGFYFAYKKYDKEHPTTFDDEFLREPPALYPPAILGYLYRFEEVCKEDLAATLMDLIRKGFIELDLNGESTQEKKPNYRLVLVENKDESNLKSHEIFVLKWFFGRISKNKQDLTLNEIDAYLKIESNAQNYLNANRQFIEKVKAEGSKHHFFDDLNKALITFGWICIIVLIIGLFDLFCLSIGITESLILAAISLSSMLLFGSYLKTIKRRSIYGNEDYVRWKAFKHFLEEFSNFDDYTMPAIALWEQYMVYAVAFGIADKVEKQMRLKFKKMDVNPDTMMNNSRFMRPNFMTFYLISRMGNTTSIARGTIQQAQAARAAKSGGGGFGGGRSFGGGGGGFRGR